MILTCPECATRYQLDPALLESEGRRVRCTECQTVWFQKPEEGLVEEQESRKSGSDQEAIPQSVRPLPELIVLPVQEKPKLFRRAAGFSVGIALALCILAGMGLIAVRHRQALVHFWPPVALVFEQIGAQISVAGQGFVFDQVKADLAGTPEAGATLTITGKVINMTDEKRALPLMEASLFVEGKELPEKTWTESFPISEVEGESVFPFTLTRDVQERDGNRLVLRFSDGALPSRHEMESGHEGETTKDSSRSAPEEKQEGHGESDKDTHDSPAQNPEHEQK